MAQYYKDVRGLANAGIKTGQISLHGKRFRASGAVKDVSTNEAFHASTYYKESSLMEDILKSQGLSLNDLAKASFDFNKGQQQIFKEKIPNIASVCYNLETLTVYDRQLEGETVVTDAEFNEAISALMAQAQPQVASQQTQPQQPAQQTQQQTQSQQQPMPDEKPQYNEYGKIVRGNRQDNVVLDHSIPHFTPPEQITSMSPEQISKMPGAEVFALVSNDPKQIKQYAEMKNLESLAKDGKLTETNLKTLTDIAFGKDSIESKAVYNSIIASGKIEGHERNEEALKSTIENYGEKTMFNESGEIVRDENKPFEPDKNIPTFNPPEPATINADGSSIVPITIKELKEANPEPLTPEPEIIADPEPELESEPAPEPEPEIEASQPDPALSQMTLSK